MNTHARLTAVIVNFNTLELLKECLQHLESLRLPELEVVVVDNGSNDGSAEWIQSLDRHRFRVVCSAHNLGFAGGCNLGIEQAAADYILLLNTDAFPRPGALQVLMDYLDQHPDVGIVGPQLVYSDGGWQRSSGLVASPRSAVLDALGITSIGHVISSVSWKHARRWLHPRPVEYLAGACMMIRRAVIDHIGGLDERLFFFVEDAEYCLRARNHGWGVHYIPQSVVIHLHGRSWAKSGYKDALNLRKKMTQAFVEELYGPKAWGRYTRWMRVNYRWRYCVHRLFKPKDPKVQKYKIAYEVYKGS